MEDRVASAHPFRERGTVEKVALDELTAELLEPRRFGPRTHERDRLVAPLAQPLSEPSAEEAGASGNEGLHPAASGPAAMGPTSKTSIPSRRLRPFASR